MQVATGALLCFRGNAHGITMETSMGRGLIPWCFREDFRGDFHETCIEAQRFRGNFLGTLGLPRKHSAFMETSTGFPWCCFHGYVHVDFVVTRWNGGSLLLWRPWRRYMMYLVHHRGSSFVMKEGKYSSALPTFLRV